LSFSRTSLVPKYCSRS